MTAAACLIAQEYAVRFTLPDYDPGKQPRFTSGGLDRPPLGIPNTTARLAKNSGDYNVTVRFNRRGLRDLKDVSDARPGDISVVGDSFAFGWGVEEKQTLSQRLEARTGRAVFNLGAPGDLRDYAAMLAYARGLGARNDDVVLAFNMSNDILDYDSSQNAQPDIPAERPSLLQHVKGLLTETSALYFLATSIINRSGVIRGLAMKFGFVVPLSAVPPRDVSDGLIEGTVRRLQAIAEGRRLTIVVIPSRGLWVGDRIAEERDIHRRFLAALRRAGLQFVDMAEAQERNGDPMAYFFKNDGHWRVVGHDLAAELVAKHMKGYAG